MGRVLYDGLVEYPDGTPATSSQMAKDVTTFLSWASEPELDQRKKMGLQAVIILSALTGLSIWVKKFKWTPIKTRKIGKSRFHSFGLTTIEDALCDSLQPSYYQALEDSIFDFLCLFVLEFWPGGIPYSV